ncbi:PAS domain S-box protein [Calycomorphotria hydatis]|uniref:Sensory/regulatory protein RpfC n=1 Tax=Calycomorphotria hydatis TaxID=2528027 RepID=A0A517T9P9_9PLAN|nr:PAS domain S-box protein [Calycomorphotria hydatis]QDT65097.1 Signal transduction histidine-protein kinase BarA [Calycomorphotria hydatis]
MATQRHSKLVTTRPDLAALRPLVASTPLPALILDEYGTIVVANQAVIEFFKILNGASSTSPGDQGNLTGTALAKLLPSVDDEHLQTCIDELSEGDQESIILEITWKSDDNKTHLIDMGVALMPQYTRQPNLYFCTFHRREVSTVTEPSGRASADRYRSLVEELPLNVFFKDVDGRFMFANKRCCRMMHTKLDDLIGLTDFDLMPPTLAKKYWADDQRVLETGKTIEVVEEYSEPGEDRIFIQTLKAPLKDENDEIIGIQGFFWDVSHRVRSERAVQVAETRHRAILEAALDPIVTLDTTGAIVEVNSAAETAFGHSAKELIGNKAKDVLVTSRARERFEKTLRAMHNEEQDSALGGRTEMRMLRKSGRSFIAEIAMRRVVLQSGNLLTLFIRDISRRKQAKQALQESNARFRRLVDSDIIGITIIHLDGRILEANRVLLDMLGYTRKDVEAGKLRWDKLTPKQYAKDDREALTRVRREGQNAPREKEYLHADGHRVPILIGELMLDARKQTCMCFVIDIAQQKETEAALQAAKDTADAANEAKSAFLANISHEIRTPMNAIIGTSDLMAETSLDHIQSDYLQVVSQSAESLLSLINSLLDFSKIEAGHFELEPAEFELRELIAGTMRSLVTDAHVKGVELVSFVDRRIPSRLIADSVRLRQVILNLVTNAVKFTSSGQIALRVDILQGSQQNVRLRFSVRDTGIGMPAEQIERVFEPFEQADNSSTRRYGGTGLGLSICRRLVNLMGSEIYCQSVMGEGTEFHFKVDLKAARQIDTYTSRLRRRSIEVFSHNSDQLNSLEEQLSLWGMKVETRRVDSMDMPALERSISGEASSDSSKKKTNGKSQASLFKPDIQLVDIPLGNDRKTAPLIERLVARQLDTPTILLVSPQHPVLQKLRLTEDPSCTVITKPINPSDLHDTMLAMLDGDLAPSKRITEPIRQATSSRVLNVLLAEDSYYNQRLIHGIFERIPHNLEIVGTGSAAVERSARESFDIILMDVQMPELDGIEATKRIREREARVGEHIPIIALTAQAMAGDRERCLEAGMDAYLSKPIRYRELTRVLDEFVDGVALPNAKKYDSTDSEPSETSEKRSADETKTSKTSAEIAHPDYWTVLLDQLGGDKNLARSLVSAFLQESKALLKKIEGNLAEKDYESLRKSLHTLKGAASSFGPSPCQELTSRAEQQLRISGENADPEEIEQVVQATLDLGDVLRQSISRT